MFRSLNASWYPSGQLIFDGAPYQHFGAAIATDGDPAWTAVCAPGDKYRNQTGAVYVYEPFYHYGWSFYVPDVLSAPVGPESEFGSSLDLEGNWLAVAAPWAVNPNSNQLGSVFIYRFKNMYERWQLIQILIPQSDSNVRVFGSKVAFGGPQSTHLAVIVPADYVAERRMASIHIFQLRDDQWEFSQRLVPPPDPNYPIGFGTIDFSESVLATSQSDRPVSSETNGVVWSYKLDGQQWMLASSYRAPEYSEMVSRFGETVAVSGDIVIAGAPGDTRDANPTTAGNVFSMIVPALGDVASDGDIGLSDAAMLVNRLEGPGHLHGGFGGPHADYDADGDVDLFDVAVFQRAIAHYRKP